ncbi:hypothetical protein GGH93_005593 [Coemansia aciculifera]|nr:hypothetical protein GGH93_005593 [Coemansia aciculifera]
MFSRNSMLRRQSAGTKSVGMTDPLTASMSDTSEGQMVDAINRLELASDDPRATGKVSPSRAYGRHEMLKEIKSSASLPVDGNVSPSHSNASASFPSTGFSRSTTATTRKVSKSFAVPRALPESPLEDSHTTGRPRAPTSLGIASAVPAEGALSPPGDSVAVAGLGLPHDSLGRRLWLYFQAAPELADLRDMIADSPAGVLVLSQSPYRGSSAEPDLGAILNDNVLFTDAAFSSEANVDSNGDGDTTSNSRKFTTASGICGVVDRGSVCALGMLPPMEDIMQAISDTDSPRTTIFDVLDKELLAGPPLLRLRIAAIHKACRLPDDRHVQVIVASAPLERTLVVDSALTTLSARIYESLDHIYKALLPHAPEPITNNDHVKVDIECIIQYAHAIELRAHTRAAAISKTRDVPGSGGGAQRSFPWITGQRASRSATSGSATPTSMTSTATDSMQVPSIDVDTESWQAHLLQLQEHISSYLSDLERETSMCGDSESRKKICTALVESVEKLATEAIYANIFSPWFSDDRMRDEQFASKVAALNVANITLENLGLVVAQETVGGELQRICAETGRMLESMNGVKSPAEKLKLVVDAHKSVVERMDRLNERTRLAKSQRQKQAAAGGAADRVAESGEDAPPMELLSADSILPLLIYSVVKANPPRFISNLRYIQRYRTRSLLTSQYEYCMTNAQAAASFVTSVDARKLGLSAEVSSSALERAMPPALVALQNLLLNNVVSSVGIDVVQGVADGGKKVAVGVFDATLGRLIDSSSQLIGRRAPWRSPSERELQIGTAAATTTTDSAGVVDEKSRDEDDVIEGVRSALTSASEQLSHEIKGHLPRTSPRVAPMRSNHLGVTSLPVIHQRFLDSDAGDLTINDVAVLLASYKELAAYARK